MQVKSYPKSFFKDNSIVFIGYILIYIKGIILMPIIIKTVGVSIYGGFILLTSILSIIFGISSFGTGFIAKRFLPTIEDKSKRAEVFYPQFFFGLLSTIVFSILFILFDKQINFSIFKNEINYSVYIVPIYLILYFLYSQVSDYFRYTSRINLMMIISVPFPYIHILLIIIYFYFFKSITINVLIISLSLSACLIVIPFSWIIFREIGIKFIFYKVKNLISDIKIGFPLVFSFIIDFILASSDRYFIAYYLSVAAVGNYNPGYIIGSLIIFIPKAMGMVMPQLMSKAIDSGNVIEAQRMQDYALKLYLLMAIPFIFGSIIMSKSILILLANKEVAENAYLISPIIALGTLFCGLNLILSNTLFVYMKTNVMFKMNLIASIFSLMANFILLYFFRNFA